jgi:hypothetical protein
MSLTPCFPFNPMSSTVTDTSHLGSLLGFFMLLPTS